MPRATKNPGRHVVFFDFDNTITPFDVFDDMLERFARDDAWVALEKEWKKGRIGSRECLGGQIASIRMPKPSLDKYIKGIKIDPYFKPLRRFLKSKKVKAYVLSDNFDYILRGVLRNHGISDLEIYSNRLKISGDRLMADFPFNNRKCPSCAHCKTKNLLAKAGRDSTIVYVGDGRSDTCPSEHADLVFAKEYLKEYCREKELPYKPFKGLKDVYEYFKNVYN